MNYLNHSHNLPLAGYVGDLSNLTLLIGAGGFLVLLAGMFGLVVSIPQAFRGSKEGWQSLCQSAIAICVGCAGLGYYFVRGVLGIY